MNSSISERVFYGSQKIIVEASLRVNDALDSFGNDKIINFPGTDYYLPLIYGLTGFRLNTTADLPAALSHIIKLLPKIEPAQADAETVHQAGLAALLAAEIIESLRYFNGESPAEADWGRYAGIIPDIKLRNMSIQLIDGRVAGLAVITGNTDAESLAPEIVSELQRRGLVTLVCGNTADALAEHGLAMGLETAVIPLGNDYLSLAHAAGTAARFSLALGSIKAGNSSALLEYAGKNLPLLAISLNESDDIQTAMLAGFSAFGFPVILTKESA